ncbi:unnamed protein product [Closterium sp. NIES-65]|nr:unnamed protein product [Closterium sp. NIES-65]
MDRSREAGEQGGVAGGGVGTHQPANPTLPSTSTPSPTTVDPVKAFSIKKFMGEDYEHWCFRMRLMYTQYKLLDLVEGKEKMSEAAELKGAWSWSALAINLNSQQPQWSVDYIRAHILEEALRQRSVERSEEGAGYGVGGGKSGFKKKWKGKNNNNPKEDGGGGQGEKSGKAAIAASMEESVTEEEQQELTSDHSGGGEQQGAGPAAEEGLEDESARVDLPSQLEPAANAKVTKRSVQRGASPHGQQIATGEKRVAAAPSRLKYSRLGGPKQGAMAVQADEGEDEEMAFCFFTPLPGEPATVVLV